eukprot:TRINITY_DN792_c0_g1_i1.p2 TRINITY_DN792_c0_g1~~TRINITY_DN792_c0_g1_i1.p2  ORF type:complete len:192 (+),score=56.96 TRINITY_DN792_c0_g1_i1:48-623(+)
MCLAAPAAPAPAAPSAELSTVYRWYVVYECVLVNLVGFVTLFFQCELQAGRAAFLKAFPQWAGVAADSLFGHYWLQGDLNCATPAARCLTYMVAGWLMIAGTLQIFINFDGLRRRVFPGDWDCPRGVKVACMYAFFVCDWYWVVLMWAFRATIGWQQIVGSAVDIALRLAFAAKPSRMFKGPPPSAPSPSC